MIHTYTLLTTLEGNVHHMRCPDCHKEVLRGPGVYRVLRDEAGNPMHGDQNALHRWAQGIHIDGVGVTG